MTAPTNKRRSIYGLLCVLILLMLEYEPQKAQATGCNFSTKACEAIEGMLCSDGTVGMECTTPGNFIVTGNFTVTGTFIWPGLPDTDASNYLAIVWNENDIANRRLNILMQGANHNFIIGADLTISGTSDINQDLTTDAGVTFATVNTGQGANELYAMDQDMLTTSSPTFGPVFTSKFDAAAYWTATQADAGGVTFDSVSDGTPGFTFSDLLTSNGLTSKYNDINFTAVPAPTAPTAALIASAGNVDAGNHSYSITFVTGIGETEQGVVSNVVTTDVGHGQIQLSNIPLGVAGVVARKIYRVKLSDGYQHYLATLPNNSATTYLDNIAETGLSADFSSERNNTTTGKFYVGSQLVGYLGTDLSGGAYSNPNVAFGVDALSTEVGGSTDGHGAANVAIGFNAMKLNSSGYNNTAVGAKALSKNTISYGNCAYGTLALRDNTIGNSNSAYGNDSLMVNTEGDNNCAFGVFSLRSNLTGDNNVAMGPSALASNVSSGENVAIGSNALFKSTSSVNIGVGAMSLYENVGGTYNTGVGYHSIEKNVSGSYNSGYGFYSLYKTTGSFNTGIGIDTLWSNVSGSGNVALGSFAGYYETGSNKLFIDNTDRASEADARLKALIYGVFAATTAAQTLSVNANLNVSDNSVIVGNETVGNISTAGNNVAPGRGTFTGAATGWTLGGGGGAPDWAYGTNNVTHANGGGTTALSPTVSLAPTAGKTYRVDFTISGYSAGTLTPRIGGTTGTARSAAGTYTEFLTATTTTNFALTPTTTFVGTVDDVSVMENAHLGLVNATASTAVNAVQNSPAIRWQGSAWNTASSDTLEWRAKATNTSAATTTSLWKLGFEKNGAAETYPLTLSNAGVLTTLGQITTSAAGAASTPAGLFTGAPSTAGTTTTDFPLLLLQPTAATASTTWSDNGTFIGVNADLAQGNLADFKVDGTSVYTLDYAGTITTARSAAPILVFRDSDCTDSDTNAEIDINATATGSGAEDIDVFMRAQKAGVLTTFMQYDASAGQTLITGDLSVSTPKNVIGLLGSVQVNVGNIASTHLYTVPASVSCVITRIVVRTASASFDQAADPVFKVGWTDSTETVVASSTYTTPASTTSAVSLTLQPDMTIGAAADVLHFNVTTGATASTTAQVDVFGYLY